MLVTVKTGEPVSGDTKTAIEEQLERLLANPFFSHSRRFPAFLRYVTVHTLAGEGDSLKERTLGIDIFGKPPSYDTATDPIVRVTAAEIRKRIAQYYQDPLHANELRISLPPGSYVPVFGDVPQEAAPDALPVAIPNDKPEPIPSAAPVIVDDASGRTRTSWRLAVAFALLTIIGLTAWRLWARSTPSAASDFWHPVLESADPVLFCIADQTQYTAITLRDAADPTRRVTLQDNLTAVVIDDVSAIAKLAGVLEANKKHYSLLGEGVTTLSQLRNGPSIMIGAFDNAWTLRLLAPLRFHFANDADMNTFSIVDAQAPASRRWEIHRSQQLATNNYRDYAIVARFTDTTTGRPTVIAAGIGRGGTIAAGELVTNEELLKKILNGLPHRNSSNVEVVLSTDIIEGEPGTPKLEAIHSW